MADLERSSKIFVTSLALHYEPVGLTIYKDPNLIPKDMPHADRELKSYCQAVILAGEGETLLLAKDKMGCKLGTSVLGFEDDMERPI